MNEKVISFIIPVYNCEKYLQKCVECIQSIDFPSYEIILVDDGSLDGSGQICDYLAARYNNVFCEHQQNQGVSSARNCGLEIASGEYVLFVDADDDIEPEKLLKLILILEKDPTIDMAIFGLSFDYYYRERRYRSDELMPALNGKMDMNEWVPRMQELYCSNSLSSVCNKVIKRNILIDHQIRLRKDMFLYEDLEFSLHCMAHCKSIYFCSDIIYHYRQSEDEGNAGRRLKRIEHLSLLVEQIEAATDELIKEKQASVRLKSMENILLSLYLVIAREKISVSDATEIRQICDDFILWINERNLQIPNEQQKFVYQLLNRQVNKLIANRTYISIRHKIAIVVKNTWVYQKLRG